MLPAQLANVAAASLPRTPPTAEFFDRVDQYLNQGPMAQPENDILGKTFAGLKNADKAPGTVGSQKSAYPAAKDLRKVLEVSGVDLENLDEFFQALAKWALHPRFIFTDEAQVQSAVQELQAHHPHLHEGTSSPFSS